MCVCVCESLSHVWLFATLWTVARQVPLSMGFSRQEYWRGNSPGDLPDPGIKPKSPAFQASSLPSEPPGKPTFIPKNIYCGIKAATSSWSHLTAGVSDGNDCGHSILSSHHCAISVESLCLTGPRHHVDKGHFHQVHRIPSAQLMALIHSSNYGSLLE